MKGSIYMVFDYMDHDLTGLLERRNYKLAPAQVQPLFHCVCNQACCFAWDHSDKALVTFKPGSSSWLCSAAW